MSKIPAELKYSKSHEWIRTEDDGTVTIGITDHAQDELGDIVYLELPEVGRVIAVDDVFGTVESVKAVSELYSPVAGEVVAVNDSLTNAEAILNESPYEKGWMIKVRPRDDSGAADLMTADAYKSEIGE